MSSAGCNCSRASTGRRKSRATLHIQALTTTRAGNAADERMPLREVEISLIRKAVDDAKGNVMKAARALGISRATVYRKLGNKKPR